MALLFIVTAGLPAHAQSSAAGANIWDAYNASTNPTGRGCSDCHGGTPTGARANAANAKSILNEAITNVGGMNKYANGGSQDLSETEKDSLVLYFETVFDTTPRSATTSFNTAVQINVSDDLVLNTGTTALTTMITGSNTPSKGTVSYNNSTRVITYTPTSGQTGSDNFTYRARNAGSTLFTSERTVNITINPPPPPNITSSNTASGTVGTPFSYTIVATNSPTSYGATSLPGGLSRSGAVISGTPTDAGTFTAPTISATNAGGTDTEPLDFTIAQGTPVLNLPSQSPSSQAFRPNTSFFVNPVATSPSPAAITYTVSPASVCTISGSTITKVGVGTCSIVAHQAANGDWFGDDSLTRNVTITQAIQSLSFPAQVPASYSFSAGSTFPIDPATSNATTTSGNPIVYSSLTLGVCTVSGTTVTMVSAGTCTLAANQAGNTNYAAAAQVTQNVTLAAGVPGAPTVTAAIGGDQRITVVFTPPANPGSPITGYTATCTLGGGSPQTGTSSTTPTIVNTPAGTNGAPWTCSVIATNAIGNSGPSNTLAVSPPTSTTPTAPVFRSANNVTFTIGTSSSFRAVVTAIPIVTPSLSGTLPTGVTAAALNVSGTRTFSGTPAAGTAGTYPLTFSATNASGTATQNFTLTVVKAPQTITFPDPADRVFAPSPSTFNLAATASSGLPVTYSSSTPSFCTTTSGGTVTMVAVGTCTLTASQAGDPSYLAASNVQQSFTISQASQSISWSTLPNRTFVASGTFTLSPLASASSNLPVTYASQTLPVCTIAGTTVTMLAAGTCTIEASQDGNANYAAATDVQRSFTITKASQTITFPAQAAQPYADGGTFGISPPATGGGSGNPIVYTSLTTGVCTVSGSTVTIVTIGTCTLAANQDGDNNYNPASQVTRNVTINAVPPGAPVAGDVTGSDATATIEFTPPTGDGGSPITGYTATCNPGNLTGNSADTPAVVTGLANGVQHTCTVAANNAAGSSAPSNAVMVTPVLRSGASLWTGACQDCHGAQPAGVRFNAAGTTGTILSYVRSIQPLMQVNVEVQALTQNELAEISKYIATFVPAISVNTPFNTAVMVDVSSHLTLGTVTFTGAGIVTQPVNGTVGAFSGTVVTYTPNPGFVGQDTFTYRGTNGNPNPNGDPRTVTVTVAAPPAPVITSPAIFAATVGQMASYQITATNSPTGYNATTAMACNGAPISGNFTVNAMTGLISGTPANAGQVTVKVCAANAGGTGSQDVSVTVSKAGQVITFNAQSPATQSFGTGTFPVNPTATGGASGNPVTYSSLTPGTCTVSGTTVTIVAAGTCTLAANQAGNANYDAALQVTRDVTITAAVPGAPTIGTATPGDGQASIAFTAPASNGGSPITGYTATCNPGGITGAGGASPVVVMGLANATTYTCSVQAANAMGNSAASGTVMVTPSATPVPPAINSANATTFTVGAAGNFSVQATGTPAPALSVMGTLPTGVTFTPGTGALAGTPALGTVGGYPLTFTATNGSGSVMQSFTLTVQKANQSISFTGPASQPFTTSNIMLSASATSGLAVTFASTTPSVCTVSGATLTLVTVGTCSITASQAGNANYNPANDVVQGFNVTQATQSITFGAQAGPLNFVAGSTFAINPVATASSGLAVSHGSTTTGVCTVLGTTVTMVSPGTCTLSANQSGSASYQAALQVTRSVTLSATAPGAPTIGTATGGNGQATLNFTAPTNNGGSAITGYTATCNPGGVTGTNATSPIVVSGLTNSVTYTCSVTATNAVGTSAASGTVMVTPLSGQGAALWAQVCDTCHSAVPAGNQLNGAGTTATVLAYVRANQPLMSGFSPVASLSNADLADIAAYIAASLPGTDVATPVNTAVMVDVASHITLTGQAWSAFTSVEIVSGPANGSLGAVNGTQVQYTPNPGYLGGDSFTYRGKRAGTHDGDPQTVTITVTPSPPVITSSTMAGGTFGSAFSYQVTATNSPTSFTADGLPAGLSISPSGLISGLPGETGSFGVTLSATNAGGTGEATLMLTVAQATQAITFGAQTSPRNWSQGGTFAISPVATGGASGNPVVHGSASPSVCTVSGTTVTIVTAGNCQLTANQAGNANYAAATEATRTVVINAVLPGAPTIGAATAGNGEAAIAFTAPASNGGSAITGYTATCNPGGVSAGGAASPIAVTGLANDVLHTCSVTATTSAGTGPASGTVNVTPQSIALVAVYSRKAHGTDGDFDIPLDAFAPVAGAVTVEPRVIGGGHRIVFVFSGPVSSVGGAGAVDPDNMPVGTAAVGFAGNEVEVLLTGIPNASRATVSVGGINGGLSASTAIGFLVGDVDGSGTVAAADAAAARARAGQGVTAANARYDITTNGTVSAADIAVARSRNGQALP